MVSTPTTREPRGTSVREWLKAYVHWHSEVRVTEAAAATAFWILLALGPAGLVTINVLGLLMPQQSIAKALGELARAAPGTFGDLLARQFVTVAENSPGSFATDALLVLTSLWTISTAVAMLMRGLRRGYGLERQGFVLVRSIAVAVSLGVIVIVGAIAFLVDLPRLWQSTLGFVISWVVLMGAIQLLYVAAVGDSATRRGLWPGAVCAALGLMRVQHVWEGLAGLSPNMSATYGPVTGLIVSMLGIWLSVMCLLVGQFVNSRSRYGLVLGR